MQTPFLLTLRELRRQQRTISYLVHTVMAKRLSIITNTRRVKDMLLSSLGPLQTGFLISASSIYFFSSFFFFFFPLLFQVPTAASNLFNNGKLESIPVLKIHASLPNLINQTTGGYDPQALHPTAQSCVSTTIHSTWSKPYKVKSQNAPTSYREGNLYCCSEGSLYLTAWKQDPRQPLLFPLEKQKVVLFCKLKQIHQNSPGEVVQG